MADRIGVDIDVLPSGDIDWEASTDDAAFTDMSPEAQQALMDARLKLAEEQKRIMGEEGYDLFTQFMAAAAIETTPYRTLEASLLQIIQSNLPNEQRKAILLAIKEEITAMHHESVEVLNRRARGEERGRDFRIPIRSTLVQYNDEISRLLNREIDRLGNK